MVVLSPRMTRFALVGWIAISIVVCVWVGWLVTRA
jgi:hypothetical protein